MTENPQWTGKPQAVAAFTTTHWSVVLNAAEADSAQADQALAQLCEIYWYPLYAYVRRKGYNADDAKDLTQEFFGRLLARNFLRNLDRRKGKFRSFLLAAMEHFLAKQWRDSHRLKRGGYQRILSLDDQDAESRYRIDPVQEISAERMFERRWALTVVEEALRRVREEFDSAKKGPLFEALQPFLSGDNADITYSQIALRLDMTQGAIKVAVHRLRARYGELIREEIARTVASSEEVEEELRHLLEVMSG